MDIDKKPKDDTSHDLDGWWSCPLHFLAGSSQSWATNRLWICDSHKWGVFRYLWSSTSWLLRCWSLNNAPPPRSWVNLVGTLISISSGSVDFFLSCCLVVCSRVHQTLTQVGGWRWIEKWYYLYMQLESHRRLDSQSVLIYGDHHPRSTCTNCWFYSYYFFYYTSRYEWKTGWNRVIKEGIQFNELRSNAVIFIFILYSPVLCISSEWHFQMRKK